jgi:hypothetical protein
MEGPDPRGNEVAEKIRSAKFRYRRSPVHITAGNRSSVTVPVVVNGWSESGIGAARTASPSAGKPLGHFPTVVFPASGRRLDIDLLTVALSHVADVEVSARSVETEPPGVSEPVRPDIPPCVSLADKRVVGRYLVRGLSVHVDPQELAEQGPQVLAVVVRVVRVPAAAKPDVEVPVRSEGEHPPVVVAVRLGHLQDRLDCRPRGISRNVRPRCRRSGPYSSRRRGRSRHNRGDKRGRATPARFRRRRERGCRGMGLGVSGRRRLSI